MFDWNKPFQTRGGCKAVLKHVLDPPWDTGETHIVYVESPSPGYDLYYQNGKFLAGEREDENDLVNIPEKKVVERWVVLGNQDIASTHSSAEYAQQTAKDWRAVGVESRIHHIREEF